MYPWWNYWFGHLFRLQLWYKIFQKFSYADYFNFISLVIKVKEYELMALLMRTLVVRDQSVFFVFLNLEMSQPNEESIDTEDLKSWKTYDAILEKRCSCKKSLFAQCNLRYSMADRMLTMVVWISLTLLNSIYNTQ